MEQKEEAKLIDEWADQVRSRQGIIGRTKAAETGEEFTTCGDIQLDNRVALILLNTVESQLPNYGVVDSEGEVSMGRNRSPLVARKLQLLPSLLFSIDWASTAPGVSWPESYFVTYVPAGNISIVTTSKDDDEIWGYADLAVGFCRAARTPEFGVKKIIQSWWKRGCGDREVGQGWETFWSAGLIDKSRAEKWRDQTFGKQRSEW
jgi:hypothetical protein